jgi:hypothetical protein
VSPPAPCYGYSCANPINLYTNEGTSSEHGKYFASTFKVTGGNGGPYTIGVSNNPLNGLYFTQTYCPPTAGACAQVISSNSITLYGTPLQAGNYPFTIKVTDNGGNSASFNFNLSVAASTVNLSPSTPAMSLGPTSVISTNTDQQFNFLAKDPENDTLNFDINWGDNLTSTVVGQSVSSGSIVGAVHKWPAQGTYNITVVVTDGKGGKSSNIFTVTVLAPPAVQPAAEAARVGAIINRNGVVMLVGSAGLYGFPDFVTFNSWGYTFSQLVTANAAEQAMNQIGIVPFKSANCSNPLDQISGNCPVANSTTVSGARVGSIVNKNGTVYLVGSTGLYGFSDLATFQSWNYTFANVITANSVELNMNMIGLVPIKSANCSNPLDQINGVCK